MSAIISLSELVSCRFMLSKTLIDARGQPTVDTVIQWLPPAWRIWINSFLDCTSKVLVYCKTVFCSPETRGCLIFNSCWAAKMIWSVNHSPLSISVLSSSCNVVSPMTLHTLIDFLGSGSSVRSIIFFFPLSNQFIWACPSDVQLVPCSLHGQCFCGIIKSPRI